MEIKEVKSEGLSREYNVTIKVSVIGYIIYRGDCTEKVKFSRLSEDRK